MEKDHSIKSVESKGASISHSSGGKIPYPKHVWSPAGGWYAQPANWKANTAVMGVVVIGITAIAWNISAEREIRPRMPEKGRFFPSRYWSRQIIEHERAEAAKEAAAKGQQ
ncbi:hypothetical protein HO133_003039 [Letharia lupina]|uniref:Uncharacterized protein n=1 Tax=Letharia lupina TaxID=560253 RepID=A0A8H6CC71_9LECA|nr:uncharacterized protein HO133_003039 [Letharia lupina]KAF6220606.1 hypothetical protein HO133_003039 [Letharia lupina]